MAVAVTLGANVASAQPATIYLDCAAKEPAYNPVSRTWIINTEAGTVDPIGGGTLVSYRTARISPTKVEGTERTEAGNLMVFDLDRVSGLLTFTFINLGVPAKDASAKFELQCRALDKPRL